MKRQTKPKIHGSAPRRAVFPFFAALLFAVCAARADAAPYIADIVGETNVEYSAVKGKTENGDLRLLGTFKIHNPDTVPFYLWVSFENGGKFTRARDGGRAPAIHLMDMELRYRDPVHRPVVKAFPKEGEFGAPPARRRLGWASPPGGGVRFGKKKSRERPADAAEAADAASRSRRRGTGAVEIVFWHEDVQAYYEMELWGVLYEPDVRAASAPGRYIENIKFEIEAAK